MKKVNWGVLSTANIGKNVVIPAMLLADNCNLYGIASRNIDNARQFQKEFGFKKAYGSYEELLEDDEIQAVYIPLPNNLHGEWIKKAAKKGKHVLCEKPIVGTKKELIEVLQVCKENKTVLMEAFAYLHSPIIKDIKETLKKGEIGELTFIEATFLTPRPNDGNIRLNKKLLGGAIYDLGCYPISLVLRLLEEEPINVKGIANFTDNGIDDYANIYLEFANNIRVNILCGMCSGQRGDCFYIYGTKGIIEAPISFNADGDLSYYIVKDKERLERKMRVKNNYQLEIEQMGRCIINGEKPFVSNEFSLLNATVIDKALEAIKY